MNGQILTAMHAPSSQQSTQPSGQLASGTTCTASVVCDDTCAACSVKHAALPAATNIANNHIARERIVPPRRDLRGMEELGVAVSVRSM